MAAYVIAEVEVTDPEGYKPYTAARARLHRRSTAGASSCAAATAEVLEGDWPQRRRVIIEFPSMEAARAWWDSPEYEKPKAMRRAASNGRLILLEGFDG